MSQQEPPCGFLRTSRPARGLDPGDLQCPPEMSPFTIGRMEVEYPAFGRIFVDGVGFDHDVVIEAGIVRARSKKPSRPLRSRYGHTPLSEAEDIPWSHSRLIIGAGHSGRLPVTEGVHEAASSRGVALEIMSTAEACAVINTLEPSDFNAVLHVAC